MTAISQIEVSEVFLVGMADLAVVRNQNVMLSTFPLGACLGVSIYDPEAKVGGVLHSLLPESSIDPGRAAGRPGMFLDTGLAMLLSRARDLQARLESLVVCVAGGSRILDETSYFNLGSRNYQVLDRLLAGYGLKIQAEDVGGLPNRSLHLNAATGEVRVKLSGQTKLQVICKPLTNT